MSDATARPHRAAPISNADLAMAYAWATTTPGRDKWTVHVQGGPDGDDPAEWLVVEYPGHDRVVAGYQPGFMIVPDRSGGWSLHDEGRGDEQHRSVRDALFAICALPPCQEQGMHALAAEWQAKGVLSDALASGRAWRSSF